tara:strand:+ start:6946 stop:7893 length:948 start_codon:yes stop_codon:yes gene_type:complete
MKALQIENLRKSYSRGPEALRGIDLDVKEGDFFALLGPNGAGKSTAIGIISSLVNKTSGDVKVFGYDLDQSPQLVKSCIGLVPQEFNFNQFEPPIEILINQAGYYGVDREEASERAEHYLKQLHLWEKRNTEARDLSGGMKRRLMIARALIHQPKLLILDEPTAGVDIEIRHSIWKFLREINNKGTTIILTTHYLEEAESLCRNIAIITQGKIAEHASMDDILRRLSQQTYILDTELPLKDNLDLGDFSVQQVGVHTLEASITTDHSLSMLFRKLDNAGIKIVSLRNKQNRLERLFMDMVANENEAKYSDDGVSK